MDREKVIKELEILRDICNAKSNMAIGKGKVAWAGYANTADDAIVLLKEQGKLKSSLPTLIKNDKDQNEYWLICSLCKHKIDALCSFCPYCGRGIEL